MVWKLVDSSGNGRVRERRANRQLQGGSGVWREVSWSLGSRERGGAKKLEMGVRPQSGAEAHSA